MGIESVSSERILAFNDSILQKESPSMGIERQLKEKHGEYYNKLAKRVPKHGD